MYLYFFFGGMVSMVAGDGKSPMKLDFVVFVFGGSSNFRFACVAPFRRFFEASRDIFILFSCAVLPTLCLALLDIDLITDSCANSLFVIQLVCAPSIVGSTIPIMEANSSN